MRNVPKGTATLTFGADDGAEGIDDDASNPPSLALSGTLREGRADFSLSRCYCSSPGEQAEGAAVLRWLGVFVFSAGSRVIFFPGFYSAMTATKNYQGALVQREASFLTDHISLEEDFETWHVTSRNSKKNHMRGLRTVPLGEDRVLWCCMSIRDFSVLRIAKKKTIATYALPESDSGRRLTLATDAIENSVVAKVSFHPELKRPLEGGFPHFSFIIGPKGFANYTGDKLALPRAAPALAKPFPRGAVRLATQQCRFSISNTLDMEIIGNWLPGAITIPVVFWGR